MDSLVLAEDGTTRKRTPEEIDRDCGWEEVYKRQEREMMRKRKPTCPEGFIVVCRGFSCGRPPQRESDLRDYTCMERDALRRQLGGYDGVF